MLEAVSTVLQNAPAAKQVVEQTSAVDSLAGNPERTQRVAPQAPFVSPFIFVDVNFDRAVVQIRDSDTGDVVRQFPSESRLQSEARASAARPVQNTATAAEVAEVAESSSAAVQAEATAAAQQAAVSSATEAAVTQQQQAAFAAAAQSGNTSAGTVTVFA